MTAREKIRGILKNYEREHLGEVSLFYSIAELAGAHEALEIVEAMPDARRANFRQWIESIDLISTGFSGGLQPQHIEKFQIYFSKVK